MTDSPVIVWAGADDLRPNLVPIDSLNPFPGNPRRHDLPVIAESLAVHGQVQAVTVNQGTRTGRPREILGGHGTCEAARLNGWTHVAVTFLDVDDVAARKIVAVLNSSHDAGGYDTADLAALLQSIVDADADLTGTGYADADMAALLAPAVVPREDNPYTREQALPRYEVVGDEPPVEGLMDTSRADALADAIRTAAIPPEARAFLLAAAQRHVVFDYRAIAEWYPHQTPEVQALVEDSALVIIDVQHAIRQGYVTYSNTIADLLDEALATEDDGGPDA